VGQAGADTLAIADTAVRVVADASPDDEPRLHPVWPLCRGLGALGFGSVQLHGALELRDDLEEAMHGFSFTHGPASPLDDARRDGEPAFDILLHLGDDLRVREACARLAASRASHFASVSWGSTWVEMRSLAGALDDGASPDSGEPAGWDSLGPLSRIAAGLVLQEALVVAGQLAEAASPASHVAFDATTGTRTREAGAAAWPPVWIESAIVEVIGAGGIGIHFLEAAAPMLGPGCELRIFDFDEVGPENLPVQAAFSPDDVGRPKARVMAEKLAPLCDPGLDIRPMPMRYEDRPASLGAPSLRVVCPDSFAARKYANDRSVADGVPLVEAGCSPLVAQQRTYLPGTTACLEHRIPDLARRVTAERAVASCVEQAFTLPGTNMIIGGILAFEALRALHPEDFGPPSCGTLVYDARFPERFGVTDVRPPCSHPSKTKKVGSRARSPR